MINKTDRIIIYVERDIEGKTIRKCVEVEPLVLFSARDFDFKDLVKKAQKELDKKLNP
jgi:hypothetical protein